MPTFKFVVFPALLAAVVGIGAASFAIEAASAQKTAPGPAVAVKKVTVIADTTLDAPAWHGIRKLEAAGFAASDVTDIVCTHLDRDHAGGLSDFPHARVHVHLAERNAALDPPTSRERERYRECHFAHGPVWVAHEDLSDKPWFGIDCIRGM